MSTSSSQRQSWIQVGSATLMLRLPHLPRGRGSNQDAVTMLLAAGAVLLWSTSAASFEIALRHVDIIPLLLGAALTTVIILSTILAARGELRAALKGSPVQWSRSALLGLINPCAYYLLLFKSYDLLPGQQAQSLCYTWPILFSLLAWPLLRKRPTREQLAAMLLCFVGILVVISQGTFTAGSIQSLAGVIAGLGSALLWSIYWILCSRRSENALQMLLRAFLVALAPITLLAWSRGELALLPWKGMAGVAYIGAAEMGLAFAMWSAALQRTHHPARVATLAYVSPAISFVLLATIAGETIMLSSVVGIGLVILGVMLQSNQRTNVPEIQF